MRMRIFWNVLKQQIAALLELLKHGVAVEACKYRDVACEGYDTYLLVLQPSTPRRSLQRRRPGRSPRLCGDRATGR